MCISIQFFSFKTIRAVEYVLEIVRMESFGHSYANIFGKPWTF